MYLQKNILKFICLCILLLNCTAAADSSTLKEMNISEWRDNDEKVTADNLKRFLPDYNQELLPNNGFERWIKGKPAAIACRTWPPGPTKNDMECATQSTDIKRSGESALRFDASYCRKEADWLIINYVFPPALRKLVYGKTLTFSGYSFIQTKPHIHGDQTMVIIRQNVGGKVTARRKRFENETGVWRKNQVSAKIMAGASRVDIKLQIGNTRDDIIQSVHIIDDLSLKFSQNDPLKMTTHFARQAFSKSVLPVEFTFGITEQITGSYSLRIALRQNNKTIRCFKLEGKEKSIRNSLNIKGLNPGTYQLKAILAVPDFGDIQSASQQITLYKGAFDE